MKKLLEKFISRCNASDYLTKMESPEYGCTMYKVTNEISKKSFIGSKQKEHAKAENDSISLVKREEKTWLWTIQV